MLRLETTVVLWHGQYVNDAKALLDLWQDKRHGCLFWGLRNVRIEGDSGDWRLVADAFVNETESA